MLLFEPCATGFDRWEERLWLAS